MTIERVAKAIKELTTTVTSEELARAALEAIADPTPEMIYAGWDDTENASVDLEEVARMWRAMHAAMMKEEK